MGVRRTPAARARGAGTKRKKSKLKVFVHIRKVGKKEGKVVEVGEYKDTIKYGKTPH